MARTPLIAGNWKMHKTVGDALALVAALRRERLPPGVEVAVCPPFTALADVSRALADSPIRLGAQDMHWEIQGAFTGEISPMMLADVGCHYVIIGHSERRQQFGETDETAARKVRAAFANGLVPILCVGERLEERDGGRTDRVVLHQTEAGVAGVEPAHAERLVIAYEPVWAIGTGRSATGAEANRVSGLIRRSLAGRFGPAAASRARILYGGSVTPDNAAEFTRQKEIDGALVGGASLDPVKFVAIIRAAVP
ncbi:MAG: triose-phosphate isomerase [Armatimonadota bacterium]|nr:triose-phosphate isomerase [Armatimonadota bacterium]MDR7499152.1 triose-phosphate isomerase [Armatimonadota bacterium]MDR7558935.1 triose-phosphate isomerase [Armatimonadota bacterium]MDR7573203.1 triose-phosphate isomerase [Armatimonadota bacterium]